MLDQATGNTRLAQGTASVPAVTIPAATWPIGAAMLQFASTSPEGVPMREAGPQEWARALAEVVDAGFNYVDLSDSWLRPADLSPQERGVLGRVVRELGLGITAICVQRQSVIDPDVEIASRHFEYSLRTLEAAADLGVGVVCLGLHRPLTAAQKDAVWFWAMPGERDPDGATGAWALAVERFRTIGERAAELGVELSLEMYEGTYLGDAASAVALVSEIGLPGVGLNPDIGNLVRAHGPIEDWESVLRATLPLANYWHVKNYYRDHDPATGAYFSVPAPLESGYINYRRAIDLALQAGFSGPICVEHYGGDGLSVCAANRDYLRRVLAAKLAGR